MSKLPDINKDFSQWYNEVVYQAELVDESPVRGCMVIRPYGYQIWENIKNIVDKRIKETGHQNAAFPLLIPESFLKREAQHVEGFAPELAVVTIAGGKTLEEPLVIRPTSETIIHYMFARWLHSWRDLPLKINQWCNIVRWEMRTRPFLRTTEFFWQEGHTAHETEQESRDEAYMMLQEYTDFAQNYLAIPVIAGRKSEAEKFPGADLTLTFEALMQDGKALQMGTSHMISQSFAKAFNMTFQDRQGNQAYPYLTSWGVTTRLIGALVMTHGDQKGLILPPAIAPIQVVIVPILKKGIDPQALYDAAQALADSLANIRVHIDRDDTKTPGAKFYSWELKGVPVRIEIGPRDLEQQQAMVVDRLGLGKEAVSCTRIGAYIDELLARIRKELFDRAYAKRESMRYHSAHLEDFGPRLREHNGLYQTGWCRSPECEIKLKEYQAATRCLLEEKHFEICFACQKPSISDVLVAKAY